MYTVGSLFAGIGGICKGFIDAGCEIIWANEIDKNACITYRKNFSHSLFEGDINEYINKAKSGEFTFPNIDILTAGFPCQAFSIAGYQKGFHDDRGNLFFSIIDIVKLIRPKVLLLENVKNLRSHDKGNTIKVIRDTIEDMNYTYTDFVLNTVEYGDIPQNRERIYIICFDKTNKKFNFENFSHTELERFLKPTPIKLTKTIHNIISSKKQNDKFYYKPDHHYYQKLSESIKNKNTVYQWRRVYVRENQNNVCPTLTANMGTGGHNIPLILDKWGIRKLTPKECSKFQGFPDNFILPKNMALSHLYKQIGNSVSIPVITRIAKNIYNFITINSNCLEKWI